MAYNAILDCVREVFYYIVNLDFRCMPIILVPHNFYGVYTQGPPVKRCNATPPQAICQSGSRTKLSFVALVKWSCWYDDDDYDDVVFVSESWMGVAHF